MKKGKLFQRDADPSSTDRLLKVIIALLLRQGEEQLLPLKRQIEILNDLGMRPIDIAETIGRSPTYVSKELVRLRRSK